MLRKKKQKRDENHWERRRLPRFSVYCSSASRRGANMTAVHSPAPWPAIATSPSPSAFHMDHTLLTYTCGNIIGIIETVLSVKIVKVYKNLFQSVAATMQEKRPVVGLASDCC